MVLAAWPCLKTIIVGIDMTPYCAAVCWFSSTLSLTTRRSCRSPAISSSTGATTRHGPHQGAQKSTRTGCSDSSTSAWKFASVTLRRSLMATTIRSEAPGARRRADAPAAQLRQQDDGLTGDPPVHLRRPELALAEDDRHLDDAEALAQRPVGELDLERVAL